MLTSELKDGGAVDASEFSPEAWSADCQHLDSVNLLVFGGLVLCPQLKTANCC